MLVTVTPSNRQSVGSRLTFSEAMNNSLAMLVEQVLKSSEFCFFSFCPLISQVPL